jgi:hypothetical protein
VVKSARKQNLTRSPPIFAAILSLPTTSPRIPETDSSEFYRTLPLSLQTDFVRDPVMLKERPCARAVPTISYRMMTFDQALRRHTWREIPDCPGRYVSRDIPPTWTVSELLGEPVQEVPLCSENAVDAVIVTPLEGGGLISFKRRDGTYRHTLNTPEGFDRKLAHLGLTI